MNPREVYGRIKNATVAIASHDESAPNLPYKIIGSGFCIHPRGVIITCEHVFREFMKKSMHQPVAEIPEEHRGKKIQQLVLWA